MLEPWRKRPLEEASLFNPAFLGSLVYEFSKEFKKQKSIGAPLTYVPIALAISLHYKTRARLPYSTITSLYEWVQDNEDLLIGFSNRVDWLRPYWQEAVRFGMLRDTLSLTEGHALTVGATKANFPTKFIQETSLETKEIIDRMKFLARWFAKSGSESTVISAWGIRL